MALDAYPQYPEGGSPEWEPVSPSQRKTTSPAGALRWWLVSASLGLYSAALVLPVTSSPSMLGAYCLFLVFGFPPALLFPMWWANVVFAVGVARLIAGRAESVILCGAVGICLALMYLPLHDALFFGDPKPLGPAFWCWIGSMVMLTVAGITLGCLKRKKTPKPVAEVSNAVRAANY